MDPLATQRWAGDGPGALCLAHATGFSKEIWGPVVAELRGLGGAIPVVAWDFPSHGASPKVDHPLDWWSFGAAAASVAVGEPAPRVGVGHSMGSAALVMAQISHPGLFDRLILIEPIVFPGPYRRTSDENLMALAARRRRRHFDSKEDASFVFGEKEVFSRWTPESLRAYVDGGLMPDGDRWVLACLPEDEAELYETAGAHGVYERLDEIDVPVLVVAGSDSKSHTPEYTEHLAERFPLGESMVVTGATHFVPMEAPAVIAEVILAQVALLRS